ncbi:hypothetical protein N2152v2_003019 [Parachlorella kessleri]
MEDNPAETLAERARRLVEQAKQERASLGESMQPQYQQQQGQYQVQYRPEDYPAEADRRILSNQAPWPVQSAWPTYTPAAFSGTRGGGLPPPQQAQQGQQMQYTTHQAQYVTQQDQASQYATYSQQPQPGQYVQQAQQAPPVQYGQYVAHPQQPQRVRYELPYQQASPLRSQFYRHEPEPIQQKTWGHPVPPPKPMTGMAIVKGGVAPTGVSRGPVMGAPGTPVRVAEPLPSAMGAQAAAPSIAQEKSAEAESTASSSSVVETAKAAAGSVADTVTGTVAGAAHKAAEVVGLASAPGEPEQKAEEAERQPSLASWASAGGQVQNLAAGSALMQQQPRVQVQPVSAAPVPGSTLDAGQQYGQGVSAQQEAVSDEEQTSSGTVVGAAQSAVGGAAASAAGAVGSAKSAVGSAADSVTGTVAGAAHKAAEVVGLAEPQHEVGEKSVATAPGGAGVAPQGSPLTQAQQPVTASVEKQEAAGEEQEQAPASTGVLGAVASAVHKAAEVVGLASAPATAEEQVKPAEQTEMPGAAPAAAGAGVLPGSALTPASEAQPTSLLEGRELAEEPREAGSEEQAPASTGVLGAVTSAVHKAAEVVGLASAPAATEEQPQPAEEPQPLSRATLVAEGVQQGPAAGHAGLQQQALAAPTVAAPAVATPAVVESPADFNQPLAKPSEAQVATLPNMMDVSADAQEEEASEGKVAPSGVLGAVAGAMQAARSLFGGGAKQAAESTAGTAGEVEDAAKAAAAQPGAAAEEAEQAVEGAAGRVVQSAKNLASAAGEMASDAAATAVGTASSAAGTVAQGAKNAASTAADTASVAADAATDVANATADTVVGAAQSAKNLASSAAEAVSDAAGTAANTASNAAGTAAEAASDVTAPVVGAAEGAADAAQQAVGSTAGAAGTAGQGIAQPTAPTFSPAFPAHSAQVPVMLPGAAATITTPATVASTTSQPAEQPVTLSHTVQVPATPTLTPMPGGPEALVVAVQPSQAVQHAPETARETVETAEEKVGEQAEQLTESYESAKERRAESVKGALTAVTNTAKEVVQGTVQPSEKVQGAASEAAETARETVEAAGEEVSQQAEQASEQASASYEGTKQRSAQGVRGALAALGNTAKGFFQSLKMPAPAPEAESEVPPVYRKAGWVEKQEGAEAETATASEVKGSTGAAAGASKPTNEEGVQEWYEAGRRRAASEAPAKAEKAPAEVMQETIEASAQKYDQAFLEQAGVKGPSGSASGAPADAVKTSIHDAAWQYDHTFQASSCEGLEGGCGTAALKADCGKALVPSERLPSADDLLTQKRGAVAQGGEDSVGGGALASIEENQRALRQDIPRAADDIVQAMAGRQAGAGASAGTGGRAASAPPALGATELSGSAAGAGGAASAGRAQPEVAGSLPEGEFSEGPATVGEELGLVGDQPAGGTGKPVEAAAEAADEEEQEEEEDEEEATEFPLPGDQMGLGFGVEPTAGDDEGSSAPIQQPPLGHTQQQERAEGQPEHSPAKRLEAGGSEEGGVGEALGSAVGAEAGLGLETSGGGLLRGEHEPGDDGPRGLSGERLTSASIPDHDPAVHATRQDSTYDGGSGRGAEGFAAETEVAGIVGGGGEDPAVGGVGVMGAGDAEGRTGWDEPSDKLESQWPAAPANASREEHVSLHCSDVSL